MKKNIFCFIIILISFISGFFLGGYLNFSPGFINKKVIEVGSDSRKPIENKKLFQKPFESNSTFKNNSTEELVFEIENLVNEKSFEYHSLESISNVYELIKDLNEEDLLALLKKLDINKIDYSLYSSIFELYAEKNPLAALDLLKVSQSYRGANVRLSSILNVLTEKDPDAALQWYIANKSKIIDDHPFSLTNIFKGISEQSLSIGINALQHLHGKDEMRRAWYGLLKSVIKNNNYSEALNMKIEMPDYVKSRMAYKWMHLNSTEAIKWYDNLDDVNEKKKLEDSIVGALLETNPEKAIDWVMSKNSDANQEDAVAPLMKSWFQVDHLSSLEWLDKQTGIDKQKVLIDYFDNLQSANINPDSAIQILDKVNDEEQRKTFAVKYHELMKDTWASSAIKEFYESYQSKYFKN